MRQLLGIEFPSFSFHKDLYVGVRGRRFCSFEMPPSEPATTAHFLAFGSQSAIRIIMPPSQDMETVKIRVLETVLAEIVQ